VVERRTPISLDHARVSSKVAEDCAHSNLPSMTKPMKVAGELIAHYALQSSGRPVLSAVVAVLLWPLILFGVNLHIK
jgi:hypothetical protein